MTAQIKLRYKTGEKLYINVEDEGEAVDITGWVFLFTAKHVKDLYKDDPLDDLAVIKIDVNEHTDPENGATEIDLTNLEVPPGQLWYDVIAYDTDNNALYSNPEPLRVTLSVTQRGIADA